MEMKLVNILEHKHLVMWIFFVCIHTLRMMYIESTHHSQDIGISFVLEEICFFVIWVSHACESSLWGDQSRYLDLFCIFALFPSIFVSLSSTLN